MQASYFATHFVKDYISLITCKGGVLWRRKRKKEQGVITENKLITLCFVCPGNVLNSSCALPALLGATFCACNYSLVGFSSYYCADQRLKDVVVPLLLCPLTLPSEGTCAPNINHLLIAKAFICCCEYLTKDCSPLTFGAFSHFLSSTLVLTLSGTDGGHGGSG